MRSLSGYVLRLLSVRLKLNHLHRLPPRIERGNEQKPNQEQGR